MSLAFYQKLYLTIHDYVVPLDIFWQYPPYILLTLNFLPWACAQEASGGHTHCQGGGGGVGGGCVCVGGGEGEALKGGYIGE